MSEVDSQANHTKSSPSSYRLTVQSVPLYRLADDLRIFVVYAVYAWGCPLVIGVVAITIHFLPKDIDWLLRPGFEQNQCWFRGEMMIEGLVGFLVYIW